MKVLVVLIASAVLVCAQGTRPAVIGNVQGVLTSAPPNQQQQPQMPTGKSSIEGTVVNATTREPVKAARVMLMGPDSLTAVSDENGHFAFRDLVAGSYVLQAQAEGYDFRFGQTAAERITLGAEDHKTDAAVTLMPNAAIAGRVTDDEGSPLANCSISAFTSEKGTNPQRRGGTTTDEKGEYLMKNIAPGAYLIAANCHTNIPLPHPLLQRTAEVELPSLTFPEKFYPNASEPSAAAKVTVAAGNTVEGIDFKLTPGGGVTVRVRVGSPDAEVLQRPMGVVLLPQDKLKRQMMQYHGRYNRQNGSVSFTNVPPGSYEVDANVFGAGHPYYGRAQVEVGNTDPPVFDMVVGPGFTVKGNVIRDEGTNVTPEGSQVFLQPMEPMRGGGAQPSPVDKDGNFSISDVAPGRWMVRVSGSGFIKSMLMNGRDVPGSILDLTSTGPAPLTIVLSDKWATADVTVSDMPNDGSQASIVLFPEGDEDMQFMQPNAFRVGTLANQNHFSTTIAPGTYFACAVQNPNPWAMVQNVSIRAALKSSCKRVDLAEGGNTSVQVSLVHEDDLQRMMSAGQD